MVRWNVMIYLAGDNNLSEEMVWALKEMQSVRVGSNVISVQFDPLGDRIAPQRYAVRTAPTDSLYSLARAVPTSQSDREVGEFLAELEKHEEVKSEIGKRLDIENTGSPTTLLEFIWSSMREKRESDWKHMLIISGHGSGSEDDFLASDESPRDSLTIPELSKTLEAAYGMLGNRKIDILGMDSCLMSTAEIYYQAGRHVDYLVAAEGFEPNSGWPYAEILNDLQGKPETVARKIVRHYLDFYFDYSIGGLSVDLSACATAGSEMLKEALTSLKSALTDGLSDASCLDAITLAHWRAQSYKSDQYVDLWDFASELKKEVRKTPGLRRTLRDSIAAACNRVMRVLTASPDKVVLESGYVGPAFQHSHGLSIYLPWSSVSPAYGQLALPMDTAWGSFLDSYVEKTRREVRRGRHPKSPRFLSQVMDGQYGSTAEDDGTAVQIRATPGYNRATPGYNRATPGYNRGKVEFLSMKNPPIGWRACALLARPGSPAQRLWRLK